MARERRTRRRTLVGVVCVVVLLVAATPAHSYLRNYTVRSAQTPSNSSSLKRDLVPVTGCPGAIFGGAAYVSPLLPYLGLTQVMPFGGLLTGAAEIDHQDAAWRLNSRAFCAEQVAALPPVADTGPYFKFFTLYEAVSPVDSKPVKSATSNCPANYTVVTGGGEIRSTVSKQAFQSFKRVNGGRSWQVVAREVAPTNANWSVSATAHCVNITTPSNLKLFIGPISQFSNPPTAFDSTSPKTLIRSCPTGQEAIGGGGRVTGNGFGDKAPEGVVITRSDTGTLVNLKHAWTAVARETEPTTAAWRLNAHVTCAPTNAG